MWTRRLTEYLAALPDERAPLSPIDTAGDSPITRFLAGLYEFSSHPLSLLLAGRRHSTELAQELERVLEVTAALEYDPADHLRRIADVVVHRITRGRQLGREEHARTLEEVGRGLAEALVRPSRQRSYDTVRLDDDDTAQPVDDQEKLHRHAGWQALQSINSEQARVFNLATFCARSVEEIAWLLNSDTETVRLQLRLASLEVAAGGVGEED